MSSLASLSAGHCLQEQQHAYIQLYHVVLCIHINPVHTCCLIFLLLRLVMVGLLYMAYPNGCWHEIFIPAKAKALPCEGASALVAAGSFACSSFDVHVLCQNMR